MIGWLHNLETECNKNTNFRKVLWTGDHTQLVVMSIQPGEDIGKEIHPDTDQIIYFQDGPAKVVLSKTKDGTPEEYDVGTGFSLVIPADTWHNVVNTGTTPLQVYTVYGPAEHVPGTVHKTKADALSDPNEEHIRFLSDL